MRITILTANIGGLSSLTELGNLIKGVKKNNPDIVVLQEVIKSEDIDVLNLLKEELGFSLMHFAFKQDFSLDYGKGLLQKESMIEGLGILTNLSFKEEKVQLPIIKGKDRWPRIAVKYTFNDFTLCNLHLSKLEESRTIAIKELPLADIYAGDFNMQPDELKRNFPFNSSFSVKKYYSFPSKNLTLDYVLLRTASFISVDTISNVSDHNAIYATIELNHG